MLLALFVLYLGVPRLRASISYLPVDTAIKRFFATREIPSIQLPALVERAKASIRVQPHNRYQEGLSLLLYLGAIDPDTSNWMRRPYLMQSLAAAEEVLGRAPAKPHMWLRVARINSALEESDEVIYSALALSILTGRVEPTLIIPRLELGLSRQTEPDSETRALLRDQILLGWRINTPKFVSSVKAGRIRLDKVRALLKTSDNDVMKEMELKFDPIVQ